MTKPSKGTELVDAPRATTSELPKEILAIGKQMQRLVDDVNKHVLNAYYKLGQLVVAAREQFRHWRSPHLGFMELLARHLGLDERTLYHCENLAKRISEEDFCKLIDAGLNWSHLRVIINQRLDLELDHWVERIKTEKLTAQDLERAVRAGQPSQRPGSGRRPAIPKNLRAGLGKFAALSAQFRSRMEHAFFCDDFDLADIVPVTPPEEIDDEVRQAYAELVAEQEQVVRAIAENNTRIRDSLVWIDQVLERRREQETPAIQAHVVDNRPASFPSVGDRRNGAREAGSVHS